MDWVNILISALTALGTGLVAFGAAKAHLDSLTKTVTENATGLQVMALKQANDMNELRKETYSTYVTQRQFEAYADSTKDQLSELRMDVKKLLELVAAGKN